MENRFWEREEPTRITTSRNALEYYPQARRLSVSRPAWVDTDGSERRGKTVTLDLRALTVDLDAQEMEAARGIFAEIAAVLDEWIAVTKEDVINA